MFRSRFQYLATTVSLFVMVAASGPLPAQLQSAVAQHRSVDARRCLPSHFVANAGQWHSDVHYAIRTQGMVIGACQSSLLLRFPQGDRGRELRLSFRGAAPDCRLESEGLARERLSFVLGDDPARWRHDVRSYESLRWRGVYDGIDAVLRRAADGQVHYDFVLQPGVDASRIVVDCSGGLALRIAENGDLRVVAPGGELRHSAPVAWEEHDGVSRPVPCRFRVLGGHSFGFEVEAQRGPGTLTIDPGLTWSSYYGGGQDEFAEDVAWGPGGSVVVVGRTSSAGLFATAGAYDPSHNGGEDVFLAQLDAAGRLQAATFLGGKGDDRPSAVVVDPSGGAVVVGWTFSSDFPTTPNAFDRTANAGFDAFVARLAPAARGLLQATYLGGSFHDYATDVELEADGSLVVVGLTRSGDFPTTPFVSQASMQGKQDGFVTKLAAGGGALSFSTFLGGSGTDTCDSVGIDSVGRVTVGGTTTSNDYPVTSGAYSTALSGPSDCVVVQLAPSGSSAVFATYFGGDGQEWLSGLEIDGAGALVIAGHTTSSGLATPGAFDPSLNGVSDGFVAKLNAQATAVQFATYLGGGGPESMLGLALTSRGEAVVVGSTSSPNWPTTLGSLQPVIPSFATPFRGDGFVTKLSDNGDRLVYSTFLADPGGDAVRGLDLDDLDVAVAAGATDGASFPVTPGAAQPTIGGGYDATISVLDLLPTGATAFGSSSPGCAGPLPIGIDSWPGVGTTFAVTCGNAPPLGVGVAYFGALGLSAPLPVAGMNLWVDPNGAWTLPIPATSNAVGAADFPVRVPQRAGLVGTGFVAQFVWLDPGAVPPCPPMGVSGSNGLSLVLQ